MPDFLRLLGLAEKISASAAGIIEEGISQYQRVEEDLERDVKVAADKAFESLIVERLVEESEYSVLSEESGLVDGDNGDKDYRWIIDPLDGSLNFSRGIPINCISIGFWKGMEPILGVVYDFNRNETFSGVVGEGAWLNNRPIRIGNVSRKKNAVLCTGFPVGTDFSRGSLLAFIEQVIEYKKLRIIGSAALSLAYVACGRSDVYLENDIKIWDIAAGLALVKAAGGIIQFSASGDETILRVRACNQELFEDLGKRSVCGGGLHFRDNTA